MNTSTMTDVAAAAGILVAGLAAITLDLHGVLPTRYLTIETILSVASGIWLGQWFVNRATARN